jgi:hypothetical protein
VIRAVPDVNIFVSLAIKKGGHPAQIFARIGEFISFTSEKIVAPAAFLDIGDREKAFRIN